MAFSARWSLKQSAELIGVVALVVSVFFLGYELRRANELAEAEASAAVFDSVNEFLLTLAENPELQRIWYAGVTDYPSLDEDEERTFQVLLTYVGNGTEVAWRYFEKGIVARNYVEKMAEELCEIVLSQPQIQKSWESRGGDRMADFNSFIDRECEQVAAN